jgi:hypothetical protein
VIEVVLRTRAEEVEMNARTWLFVVAALSLAGACGVDDEDEVVYSPDELGAALLTAADIGTDWTEQARLVFDTRSETPPAMDPGMWCPEAQDVPDDLYSLIADGGAFVEHRSSESTRAGSTSGRSFHGVTEQLWSGPDAESYVDTVAAGFETCTGETWKVEDATASVAALDGDDVGNDSTMALVTYVTPGPDGDYAWRGRQLVARVGATVMLIQELDVQQVDSQPRFTDSEWQRIVEIAAERVEALSDH